MTAMRFVAAHVLLAAPLICATQAAESAKDRPAAADSKPSPLAGLPSRTGPHIEKIRALGDNEWLMLGTPEADPKWGVARGRAWGGRSLTFAPDLRGAFFCGTGVHGYVNPEGHMMDDLWFYDIPANRWICLYPGAHGATMKLRLDEHGFEVDEQGEHVPVSYLSHGYGNSTYDSDRKKFVVVWCQSPWWTKAIPQRWDWLDRQFESVRNRSYGNPGPVIASNKHPLFWDVATGKWERRFVEGPGPDGWNGIAEYIPSLKKTFYSQQLGRKVWLYDPVSNSWESLDAGGGFQGHNGCYDSRRNRVYAGHRENFGYYDLDDRSKGWTLIEGKNQPGDFGTSNTGSFNFDAASGKIVWHTPDGLIVYDPDADAWESPPQTMPEFDKVNGLKVHGFYDDRLNAHFYYYAGDSKSNHARMFVYRHARSPSTR